MLIKALCREITRKLGFLKGERVSEILWTHPPPSSSPHLTPALLEKLSDITK